MAFAKDVLAIVHLLDVSPFCISEFDQPNHHQEAKRFQIGIASMLMGQKPSSFEPIYGPPY
jgi:hypothetical protein